jgi:hypothetical protein
MFDVVRIITLGFLQGSKKVKSTVNVCQVIISGCSLLEMPSFYLLIRETKAIFVFYVRVEAYLHVYITVKLKAIMLLEIT